MTEIVSVFECCICKIHVINTIVFEAIITSVFIGLKIINQELAHWPYFLRSSSKTHSISTRLLEA